jgi:hypothetical protein
METATSSTVLRSTLSHVAEIVPSRAMSDRKRMRPNWSESANYGKGISSVGSGLLPLGQPVRPLED